jgi:hypothetical protein
MSGYCPTDPCSPCAKTHPLNLCFSTLSVTGLNPSASVALRFDNQADGSAHFWSGVTDGNGVATIPIADSPNFVAGVQYRLTSLGYDFCYLLKFEHRADVNGWITGTDETVETC